MRLTTFLPLLLTIIPFTTADDASFADSRFKSTMLSTHNAARREHHAPALTWDDSLASFANSWVQSCVPGHSGKKDMGENIAMGSGKSATELVTMWIKERAKFDFQRGGFSDDTGHFTQVVWKGTKKVGCGRKKCGNSWILSCNYQPAGNMDGKFRENVAKNSK